MKIRNIVTILLLLSQLFLSSMAYQLDLSVDEEIKKKYNSEQLKYDVPNLPKIDTSSSISVPKATLNYDTIKPQISKADMTKALKIPRGTKFQVKSVQTLTDNIKSGNVVSFVTTEAVYKKSVTIPVGTRIYATVLNSHTPQIFGNGGLLVLRVESVSYNGKTFSSDGRVTKANQKKIFLNNIKGKHSYRKGISKQIDKGETFYKKSHNVANKVSKVPIIGFVSFIPTVIGATGYCLCSLLSPITAIGTKGASISIPSGSRFELKLTHDTYVY